MKKKATTKKVVKKAVKAAAGKPSGGPEAIRALDAQFMKAANARDAAALVKAFYAPEAVLMPPGHPIVEGRANIQAFLQGLIDAGFTSIKLETTSTASAGDLAWGRGKYTLSMTPAGGVPVEDAGKYIVCYRRQPSGSWRAVADIFNSDKAPA